MFFAPPAKVPRTQRRTLLSGTPTPTYARTSELASGLTEASPASLGDAVVVDAVHRTAMPAASFLSGSGTHMCWTVDESKKLLRLWNVRHAGWEQAAPRLAEIPYFAAASEGLPLFVSEMSEVEESLAFCTARGAISSLDHSIEMQLLDSDGGAAVSSFVCARRQLEAETVLVTVLGTTTGVLLVDVKYDGTHTTLEFDRRDVASFRWMPKSHNNLSAESLEEVDENEVSVEDGNEEALDTKAVRTSLRARHGSSTPSSPSSPSSGWWQSLKSLVGSGGNRSGGGRLQGSDGARLSQGDRFVPNREGDADGTRTRPLSAVGRGRRGDSVFAFTHLAFRYHYPEQVVAVNAMGEMFLFVFEPLRPPADAAERHPGVCIKWATSLTASLNRPGRVVALAETRHKMCVLYYVAGTASHPLAALWLVTVDASLGKVVNFVALSAVADVVSAAARMPAHHMKIFADDTHREVFVCIGSYLLRVNNQVGVRQPCSSEDIVHIKHLEQPVSSLLLDGCRLVTLDINGPHLTVPNVYAECMLRSDAQATERGRNSDGSGESELKSILDAVRTDPKLTLDNAVLYASEALSTQDTPQQSSLAGGSGNWARRDLNVEDESLILRVTRQLTARQQAHRQFVLAVLQHAQVRSQLSPETLAQLLSTQEALLSLSALRSLQNVGLQHSAERGGQLALVQRSLPSFPAVLSAVQRDVTAVATVPPSSSGNLLQRRPSQHGDADEVQQPRLVKSAEQLERCQQLLRRAIIRVADEIRQEHKQQQQQQTRPIAASSGAATASDTAARLTAAELCFSCPANVVRMLRYLDTYMAEVRHTVSLSLEEKYAECYAVGCVFVVVMQTVVESREDVAKVYEVPPAVQAQQWTSSTNVVSGVEQCFSRCCVQLSDLLADICEGLPGAATSAALLSLTLQHKYDLLDVVVNLLNFSLGNSTHHDGDFIASAITNTILREPFVSAPVGYPHGAPCPSPGCVEIGRRVVLMSEQLALRYDVTRILMAFALATPVDDPAGSPEAYERLQSYCLRCDRVLDAALATLWQQGREWELQNLPSVLAHVPDVRERRNRFLEAHAPHLLWLAEPTRYDAILCEGQTAPPYVAYGPTQMAHRSRCNALARLAAVATGDAAATASSSRFAEVQLAEEIVKAQQDFLSPQHDGVTLGPQAAVQRLLELQGNVGAWVQAAVVASRTMRPTSEDLLVQVLRRCRAHDGEALRDIYAKSVSERETDAQLRETALGRAVVACATLQDVELLSRVCETVLRADEFALLSSWLAYLWTSSNEAA